MSKDSPRYEEQLYRLWKEQRFSSPLKTHGGERVEVLNTGEQNSDLSGPDFKNARIRIGNLIYVGDVEIDQNYYDWKNHGHNIDNKYNKVILHASFKNNSHHDYVYTRDGRKIPTVCLENFTDAKEISGMKNEPLSEKKAYVRIMRCSDQIAEISEVRRMKVLSELGVGRIEKKVKRIYDRLRELLYIKEFHLKEPIIKYELTPEFVNKKFEHSDFHDKMIWQQALFEFIFEALGYSKNKKIMNNLARSVTLNYLSRTITEEKYISIEASLFNIAGLVPKITDYNKDKISQYVIKLNEYWKILCKIYDGKMYEDTDWQFFRLRPQNFPTIRIAGGSRIIDSILNKELIEKLIKKVKEIRNYNVLIRSIRSMFVVKAEGYWKHHFVFEDETHKDLKYFIGSSRADEIIINVIIPFLILYFDIFGKKELSKRVFRIYHLFVQRSENKIVHEVAEALDAEELIHRTVYTQGMLELFRNYCSKNKCRECKFGIELFE